MASQESFELFARSNAQMLHRTAWLLCRDRHTAEDLVQETLAKVFVKWRDKATIDNPAAYARTTLVRLFISTRRRRSATEVISDDPTQGHPIPGPYGFTTQADPALDVADTMALHRAMSEMSPKDQAVLVLRYFGDQSVADTSTAMGISEAAVRTRTHRALGRLRLQLGSDFLVLAK
ncbi:SigE family RNA polymerase sigma factor [Propionibacteriaceae bacterium Y1685]|uniref:SigE family RNA polymerase sigma factor n=1 Tax=Microlunatus sp. Y1700 TaxID=3418487 RepID=UPI003B7AE01E